MTTRDEKIKNNATQYEIDSIYYRIYLKPFHKNLIPNGLFWFFIYIKPNKFFCLFGSIYCKSQDVFALSWRRWKINQKGVVSGCICYPFSYIIPLLQISIIVSCTLLKKHIHFISFWLSWQPNMEMIDLFFLSKRQRQHTHIYTHTYTHYLIHLYYCRTKKKKQL